MGALGIQRGAIAPQTVGNPEAAAMEALEAGLPDRLEGRSGPLLTHHGR